MPLHVDKQSVFEKCAREKRWDNLLSQVSREQSRRKAWMKLPRGVMIDRLKPSKHLKLNYWKSQFDEFKLLSIEIDHF
jgi:hypothetical protein